VVCGLGLLAAIWIYQVSPHWIQEMSSNLQVVSARGGVADPGPRGISNGTAGMIINLQAVFSVFHDDPRFYNPATWVVCAPLFIAWFMRTLREGSSHGDKWLALAALVPLSMLTVYHRPYDAKVLILAVPACAALWVQGGARRWFGILTTSAAIGVTSDIPSTLVTTLSRRLPTNPVGISDAILTVVIGRPASLILLAMSIFYVWAYVCRSKPCEA
jgi:hypothetical protein